MVALKKNTSIATLNLLWQAGKNITGKNIRNSAQKAQDLITCLSNNKEIDDEVRSTYIAFLAREHLNLNTLDAMDVPLIRYACSTWRAPLSIKTLIAFGADVTCINNFLNKNPKLKAQVNALIAIRDSLPHLMITTHHPLFLTDNNPLQTTIEYL